MRSSATRVQPVPVRARTHYSRPCWPVGLRRRRQRSDTAASGQPPQTWTAGVFQPSSHFAALCQNPRSGNDPISGNAYPDAQGTTLDENNWLRSWSNELYLWYSEIPDMNPATYCNDRGVLRRPEDPGHHCDRDTQGPLPLHVRHLGLGAAVPVRGRRRLRRRLRPGVGHRRRAWCTSPSCGPDTRPPRPTSPAARRSSPSTAST